MLGLSGKPRKRYTGHRVYMHFMRRDGYHISFLEEDMQTSLPKQLTFASPEKIFEMMDRWGEDRTEEKHAAIERELTIGRPGGVWLLLTPEQYARLKKR